MKYGFADTTAHDIYDVVSNASEVTAGEIRNTDTTPWKMVRDLHQILPASKAVTLFENDNPIFVFGHSPGETRNRRVTWFVAKQRYFDLGARGVRLARKHLKLVKATWPKIIFDSYSFSDHRDCERWFKLLGFVRYWPLNQPPNGRVFMLDTSK